jgi:hypothetical protein
MANIKHHSIHFGSILFVTMLFCIVAYTALFSIPSSHSKAAAAEKELRGQLKLSAQPITARLIDYQVTRQFSWYGKSESCHVRYIIHYYDGTISPEVTAEHNMAYNKDICDDFRGRVNTDLTGRTVGANPENTRLDIELSQLSDDEVYLSRSKAGTYIFVGVAFLIYVALKTHLIRSWRRNLPVVSAKKR